MDDLTSGFTVAETARFVLELDARTNRHHLFDMSGKGRHLILVSDYPLYGVRNLLNEQYARIQQLEGIEARLKHNIAEYDQRITDLERHANEAPAFNDVFLESAEENRQLRTISQHILDGINHE